MSARASVMSIQADKPCSFLFIPQNFAWILHNTFCLYPMPRLKSTQVFVESKKIQEKSRLYLKYFVVPWCFQVQDH